MAISTGLFTEKQLDNFDKISTKIEKNQAKVISGKSLTEPAEDPEKAIKVSVLDEKIRQTENFIGNLGKAGERLSVADMDLGNIHGPQQMAQMALCRIVQNSAKKCNSF